MISAALGIAVRDFRIWSSYRTRFVSTFFAAAVSVTLFYYVSRLVSSPEVGTSDDYYGYVVTGTVTLELVTATLAAPLASLRSELLTGNFERIVVSPFGPVASIASLAIFPLCLAVLVAAVTIGYAAAVFGLDLVFPDALVAIPIGALAAFSFAPFGIALSAAILVFKQTNAGAAFVVTAISVIAGLYFPVTLLPDWIEWTSDVQPFTPAADLLRHFLVGTPMPGSVGGALAKLIGFIAVTLPPAILLLRASVRRSRRNGTITEY
jgi:ABC-2 type transport system permease protein